MYYRGAAAAIIVYDITQEVIIVSFQNLVFHCMFLMLTIVVWLVYRAIYFSVINFFDSSMDVAMGTDYGNRFWA